LFEFELYKRTGFAIFGHIISRKQVRKKKKRNKTKNKQNRRKRNKRKNKKKGRNLKNYFMVRFCAGSVGTDV